MRKCYDTCPQTAPYLQGLECVSSCKTFYFKNDSASNMLVCVDGCSGFYISSGNMRQCVSECPALSVDRECVTQCPEAYQYIDGTACKAFCLFYSIDQIRGYVCEKSCVLSRENSKRGNF